MYSVTQSNLNPIHTNSFDKRYEFILKVNEFCANLKKLIRLFREFVIIHAETKVTSCVLY